MKWSQEMDSVVRDGAARGVTLGAVAAILTRSLGVIITRDAVSARSRRKLKVSFAASRSELQKAATIKSLSAANAKRHVDSTWTAPRVALLKRLYAEGQSAAQIANVLNVTRNAACGQIHRLGLPKRGRSTRARNVVRIRTMSKPKPPRAPNVKPSKADGTRQGVTALHRAGGGYDRGPARPSKMVSIPIAVECSPVHFLDRREGGCRWPVGEATGADQACCNNAVGGDGPYCPGHHAVGYVQPKTTASQLARSLRKYA